MINSNRPALSIAMALGLLRAGTSRLLDRRTASSISRLHLQWVRRCHRPFRRRTLSAAGGLPPITRRKTARVRKQRQREVSANSLTSSRLGPSGGVMMYLADQSTPTELRLRGGPGGKTYIGPADGEVGGSQDREVVLFDGRILILRWMDSEVQGRYGTMVLCPLRHRRRTAHRRKPKPKTAPKPQ
mgnify:CR=1 FL=1